MGKAEILQHKGSGLYRVRLLYNEARAREEIEQLEKKIEHIQERLDALRSELDEAESAYDDARATLDQAIWDWQAAKDDEEQDEDTAWEELKEAQKAVIQAQYDPAGLRSKKRIQRIQEGEREAARKRINLIERKLPDNPEVDAWCADLTTSLSGTVGTIEVPGSDQHVQIRPGYEDGAVWNPDRDGQLTPIISQTPAGAFWNTAMLPGWQTWRPLYRRGTIRDINSEADTCGVDLSPETSSAQWIEVNAGRESLEDVPVKYMNCNAQAFQDGDEVVVELQSQDWEQPRVIGFVEEPARCSFYVKIRINDYDCTKSKRIGLLPKDKIGDLEIWHELVADAWTDSAGVAGPFTLQGEDPSELVVVLQAYNGLFTHFYQREDIRKSTVGYKKNPGGTWLFPDWPDYYSFEVVIDDQTDDFYNAQIVQVWPVKWLPSPYTLDTFVQDSVMRADGEEVQGIEVPFAGLKTVQHRKKRKWRQPRIDNWKPDVEKTGHFVFREDGLPNVEFNGSTTVGNEYKVSFTGNTGISNKSASKKFDWPRVQLGPACRHDQWHVDFVTNTEFQLTFKDLPGLYSGRKDQDFAPIDPNTAETIVSIPRETWSYANWGEGDSVSFLVQSTFEMFWNDSAGGEDDNWVHNDEEESYTTQNYVDTYTLGFDEIFNWALYQKGWRGVFQDGDAITFDVISGQTGLELCSCDPVADAEYNEEISYLFGLNDYQDLQIPYRRSRSTYISWCPDSLTPAGWDWHGFYSTILRQAQEPDQDFNALAMFPIGDSRGLNPQMDGMHLVTQVQASEHQVWDEREKEDGDIVINERCSWDNIVPYEAGGEGTFDDVDHDYFEMVDIPREWI